MDTGKVIAYAIGAIFLIYIIMLIFPYLVAFLALCGAWYLYQEYEKSNRRH